MHGRQALLLQKRSPCWFKEVSEPTDQGWFTFKYILVRYSRLKINVCLIIPSLLHVTGANVLYIVKMLVFFL